MTHLELAQGTRNLGLFNYLALPASIAIYGGNAVFTTEVGTQATRHGITLQKAALAGIDNKGYSQQKYDDKVILSDNASMLAGFASVVWDTEHLNKPVLFAQCHVSVTDYMLKLDAECTPFAQAMHDLMANNIADLTGYVTVAQLLTLQQEITTFQGDKGTSQSVNAASPADTAAFKTALRTENLSVPVILKMVKIFKTTQPTFYAKVVLLCELPPVSVLHTDVIVQVLKTEDNAPVTDAHMTLSNTKKTGDADVSGDIEIDEVHNGKATMTITEPNRITVVQEINIQAKHVNNFVVHMTLKPPPPPPVV